MERSPMVALAQTNASILEMQPKIDTLVYSLEKTTIKKLILNVLSTTLDYQDIYDLNSKSLEGNDRNYIEIIEKEKQLLSDYNEFKRMLYESVCNNQLSSYKILKNFKEICKSVDKFFSSGFEKQNDVEVDVELATDYKLSYIEYKEFYTTSYLLWFYFDVLDKARFITYSKAESNHRIGKEYALKLNNYDLAIKYYKIAANLNPAIPLFWIDTGMALIRTEKYNESLEYFNHVIESISSKNIKALYGKALALFKLNIFDNALDYCEQIFTIDPLHEETIILKGKINRHLKLNK